MENLRENGTIGVLILNMEVTAMLMLTRKKNEKIVIGDDITITVMEIKDGMVRLGINAPKEIPVHRLEIYKAIARSEGGPGLRHNDPHRGKRDDA